MHWTGKVESVAFTIGGREIAWYGIIITAAMLIGLLLAILFSKKLKLKSDDLLEMFLIAIPLAVIGGRFGYVLFRPHTYYILGRAFTWNDFVNCLAIWEGGITIMTAVPFGVLGGLIWAKWRKLDFLYIVDNIICVVLLCQAIGRWGNFCNQEIYGLAVTNPKLQFFPYAVFIAWDETWHQATFFYESVANILGFILMYNLIRRVDVKGFGTILYVAVYTFIRGIMETFRDDSVVNGVHFNMIICFVVCALALAAIAFLIVRAKKKGKRVWYGKGIPIAQYLPARLADRVKTETPAEQTK